MEGLWRIAKRRADKLKPPRVSAFLLSWPGCTRGYRNARRSRRMSPLDYDTRFHATFNRPGVTVANGCCSSAPSNRRINSILRSLRFKLSQPIESRNSKIFGRVPFLETPRDLFVSRTHRPRISGQRRGEARCSPRVSLMGSRTDCCHLFSFPLLFCPNSSLPASGSLNPSIQVPVYLLPTVWRTHPFSQSTPSQYIYPEKNSRAPIPFLIFEERDIDSLR